jgi:RNA polymerase sigma-70 factor (ECF subfamily)
MLTKYTTHGVHDLVIASQTGDEVAFAQLYDLLYAQVYQYIYRRVYDAASAEDITSNIFYVLITKLHTFTWQHESAFYAWVFRIALNEVHDFFKASNRLVLKEDWLDFDDDGTESEQLSQSLDREIDRDDLRAALTHLDDKNRTLIELRYFADLDYSTIAQIVGKREGAVRVKIHRIVEDLRQDMQRNRGKELI